MNSSRFPLAFLALLLLVATAAAGLPASVASPGEHDSDRYLLAVSLDASYTLARVASFGGRVRWIGESSAVVETDAFGLAAYRGAGFAAAVIDHPLATGGYMIFEDHEGRGLPPDLTRGATVAWREGAVMLYRGLDPGRLSGLTGSHDVHVSRLPRELPLVSYLAHPPPPLVMRALERAEIQPARAEPRGSLLDGLEERLRAHMLALSVDSTGAPRSRYAFRADTPAFATPYIHEAYLDALGGRGSVTLMSGFQCGHFDSTRDSTALEPNVLATVPGRGPGHAKLIISAHYDAIATRTPGWNWRTDPAPGQDDNASGVAATIEILRLLAPLDFDFDLVAASWACEEILPDALWGSRAYADSSVARGDTILAVINLDMLGYNRPGENRLDILTNDGSQWIADFLLLPGQPPGWAGRAQKLIHLERPYSDHNSFWDVGIDAVTIDEHENVRETNPNYHRVTDLDGTTRMDQVVAAVRMVTAAISALGSRPEPDLALGPGAMSLVWPCSPGNPDCGPGEVLNLRPDVGDTITITATLRNVGRAMDTTRDVRIDFLVTDANGRDEALGSRTIAAALPLGGEVDVSAGWEVPASARGRVTFKALIGDQAGGADFDTANNAASDSLVVDASGFSLWDAYVFPNPATGPADLRIHFQLSQPASARITIATMSGEVLGDRAFYYEVGDPADRTQLGDNQFSWQQIAGNANPASGLYVATIQSGTRQGATASARVTFAIKR